MSEEEAKAYIVGVALGDGNLSNPNGRAVRLRITCDSKYPNIANEIQTALKIIFPNNKVSLVDRGATHFDISLYSNQLDSFIPWKVGGGSKIHQAAHVPDWILENENYSKLCLKGLIQTDGCVYKDRGYTMTHFTNCIPELSYNVFNMMQELGYSPRIYTIPVKTLPKYVVRLASNCEAFLSEINVSKS